ncbi:MAG: SLBB domain-containing protein [Ignavibacteria bacterium]|nr:SLBB domain-containing protein [Ignavibacteria bacterium]
MKKILVIIFLLCVGTLYSIFCQKQPKEEPILNYIITGIRENQIDTLAYQTGQRIIKETEGLVEKEIDPDKYLLGPQDRLTISIISTRPRELEVEVSPEGKLSIPEVGVVNVKGLTLSQAQKVIVEKVKTILKATEVNVLLKNIRKFKVSIAGAVQKSAIVSASSTDRVSEIIDKAGGFKENASLRKILLYRNDGKEIIRVDLYKFFFLNDRESNPFVTGGDHIIVPFASENEYIEAQGEVLRPGKFEFLEGDSLSTLLRFAQGFTELALLDSVEFVRQKDGNIFETRILNVSSWKEKIRHTYEKIPGDFPLKLGDRIFIRKIGSWKKPSSVIIEGEVLYPGRYAIDEHTVRISDLLAKSGGFTKDADIEKVRFIRQSLLNVIDPEMERLSRIPPSEMSKNEYRYFLSRVNERKGLMSINFLRILENPNSDDNIVLQDLDSIYVPKKNEFVNIQGRVNNPGLVAYKPGYNYLDYIQLAGGFGFRADEDATLVVKSKGEQFRARDLNYKIEPGDNILVPPQEEVTFFEIFTTALTITTQILTIAGVVLAFIKL